LFVPAFSATLARYYGLAFHLPFARCSKQGNCMELHQVRGSATGNILSVPRVSHARRGHVQRLSGDYPVRFPDLDDPVARRKQRARFVIWASSQCSAYSTTCALAFSVLHMKSQQFCEAYVQQAPSRTQWSDEDTLTLDIAEMLLLAQFVSFAHFNFYHHYPESRDLGPEDIAGDLYKVMVGPGADDLLRTWLTGTSGLAFYASRLRQVLRIECRQPASVEPKCYRPVGLCFEHKDHNPAFVKAPAGAYTGESSRSARRSGAADNVSGRSLSCFKCGKGHTASTCKKTLGTAAGNLAILLAARGNRPQRRSAAIKFAKEHKLDLGLQG